VGAGGTGVGSGVGSGVGAGGSGVGSGVGSALGSSDGLSVGDAVGQGRAAIPDPVGDGTANEGITPFGSGVGMMKHDGDGPGEPHPLPATTAPQVRPNGLKLPL
jgi:hypothetical protein